MEAKNSMFAVFPMRGRATIRSFDAAAYSLESASEVAPRSAGLPVRFRLFADERAKKHLAHASANEIITR